MVTAELAVAILGAVAVLATICWGLAVLVWQLRCVDAASAVARQLARGDEAAARVAIAAAPQGATVVSGRRGGVVTVVVTARPHPGGRWLPAVSLRATAAVRSEPGVR